MAVMTINSDSLTDIADSIREKLGVETTYLPSEMAAAIDGITGVTQEDNGKVVVNGTLVAQTATSVDENGTYDTTTNDSVVVDVPNSYTAADEGKVVSSGSLVAQTSLSVTENGTYDTTENDEVVVQVESGATAIPDKILPQYPFDPTIGTRAVRIKTTSTVNVYTTQLGIYDKDNGFVATESEVSYRSPSNVDVNGVVKLSYIFKVVAIVDVIYNGRLYAAGSTVFQASSNTQQCDIVVAESVLEMGTLVYAVTDMSGIGGADKSYAVKCEVEEDETYGWYPNPTGVYKKIGGTWTLIKSITS